MSISAANTNKALMGFPMIPFELSHFWTIYNEIWAGDTLIVTGVLPGDTVAAATFNRQSAPKGSWIASALVGVQ
jgi:hypothetical protein